MITALVIARDEEGNIADCVRSLEGLAGQVLVAVDSRTEDRTMEMAKGAGAEAFTVEWRGYGATKNEALRRAAGDWVLWIDADERMTPELAAEIKARLGSRHGCSAFALPRRAFFIGRWIKHCGWYPGYVVRLFQKGKARFEEKPVHEGLKVEGRISRLKNPLLHMTDPTLDRYLDKFNKYTSLASRELYDRGRRTGIFDVTIRPLAFFFKMYLVKLGFLDGIEGLILCILSAYYVLVKYLKLWELELGPRSAREA